MADWNEQKSFSEKSISAGLVCFSAFGVNIAVEYETPIFTEIEILQNLKRIVPPGNQISESEKTTHRFKILTSDFDGKPVFEAFKEEEKIAVAGTKSLLFDLFESRFRLTIAEFAVGKVFLHAGVVGWKGKGLVLPGKSFHGKTTLVAELVKRGASYYSDEYAVLDEDGFVHPFPKMLSVRGIIDEFQQMDLPVETFGGKAAVKPCEVGMVLLTEFEKEALWKPEIINPGEGMLEIISHTIPIRYKPEFSLKVLNKIVNRAIITKSQRGEAVVFADLILDFFERQVIEKLF